MTKHFRFKLFFSVIGLACVLTGITCKETPIEPPPVGADTTSHEFSWSVDTIGIPSSGLRAAWGTGADNVYAVGIVYLPNRALPTNIMHWNGNNWSPIDYVEGELQSIIGFGSTDIWVVGFWQVGSDLYSLVGRWDGTRWQTSIMQQFRGLFSIWGTSSSNLVACGERGTILHYDGTRWTSMTSGTSHNLYGIWGSGNEIYAVGGTASTGMGILLKYQNGFWKKIYERVYSPDSLSGRQSAVWSVKRNMFFVGVYAGHDSSWARLPVPDDNTYIEKTFGNRENDVFMVGHFGLIMHYNGLSWKRYDQFYHKPGVDVAFGGWSDARNILVVGTTGGGRAIAYRGTR